MAREQMIFARGKWEFATIEANSTNGREQWIRRDQSWICYVGEEIARMPVPAKPRKQGK